MHYHPGPDGRLCNCASEGTGWLDWEARDVRAAQPGGPLAASDAAARREPRRFRARWSRKLFSVPKDGRQVISMLGDAKAQVSGMGRLDADEIHSLLIEQPQPALPGAPPGTPK